MGVEEESAAVSKHPKSIYRENLRGFTLLETLIGIAILVVAITATFTAVQSGLSSSIESRDQVTAFFLAQEGIEFIRNARDTNVLTSGGVNWLVGPPKDFSTACMGGRYCTVDSVSNTVTSCPTPTLLSSCPFLKQDRVTNSPTYGMYGENASWTTTLFRRVIQIQSISADEVVITVTIDWSKGAFPKTFKVHESIFNWQ